MFDQIYLKAKKFARPIAQHRRLFERAKYWRTEVLSPQQGNDLIALSIDRPYAIGKIGSVEMAALRHYLSRADSSGFCEFPEWQANSLYRNAGVFPPEARVFSRFCTIYAGALTRIDVLAVWFNRGEHAVKRRLAANAAVTALRALEPYYHVQPWSQHLAGKRVLVVSPFTDTIQAQYARRERVWQARPQVLPEFELLTLRSPLSAFLTPPAYPDWFVALDAMREQMASMRFEVAIVGAGAWSLPLVAHAKSLGAFAIHLGGTVQLLFGIKGGRWDKHPRISAFYNEAWTRPSPSETPQGIQKIEGGCYW
jgi:hypothetical protein